MSRLSQRAEKYRGRSVLAMFFHVVLLTLFGLMPAHSQTSQFLGRITEATIPSNGLSGNFKRAARFTLGARGTITVSGPGQKASARRCARAGQVAANTRAASACAT